MLYGAEVWAEAMRVASYRKVLQRVQRKMALRVSRAYRTVSYEAAMVIAGLVPINLMAEEIREVYITNINKKGVRDDTERKWQCVWENSTMGVWTKRLIPEAAGWRKRKHRDIDYYLTQALRGHGILPTKLERAQMENVRAAA